MVVIGEFFGGLGLVVGVLCRFSAASLIMIMFGAIAMVHGKNGFFLSAGGFEYNRRRIGVLAPLLVGVAGKLHSSQLWPRTTGTRVGRPMVFFE